MENPFVYGEVVPAASFVDRIDELDRLVRDLASGQKVFLISPRRYGKSSLIRQALRAVGRGGALTSEVTVSSYSSYLAFLEGYTRSLLAMQTGWDKARTWLKDAIAGARPELRLEADSSGAMGMAVKFPSVRTDRDISRLASEVFALPGRLSDLRKTRIVIALDEFQAINAFNGGSVEHALQGGRPASAQRRVCLRGLRAQSDGAHARAEAAVLQSRTGDAPGENSSRYFLGVHRSEIFEDRHQARAGPGRPRSSTWPATCRTTCSGSRTRAGMTRAQQASAGSAWTICMRRSTGCLPSRRRCSRLCGSA